MALLDELRELNEVELKLMCARVAMVDALERSEAHREAIELLEQAGRSVLSIVERMNEQGRVLATRRA